MVGLLLAAGSLVLLTGTARADSAPPTVSPASPATVAADALPTVQISGVAWAQVVVGDTVYVGGSFTTARPAGAPAGTQETPRANLLAYDIRTGELVASFAHDLDGQVLALAASPDGTRVYAAGDFTTVDGQTRRRVAAFDTASGALVPSFAPAVQSQVRALAVTADTVYLGGSITAVGSVSRSRLAAVRASDGGLLPWAPVPGVGSTAGNTDGNTNTSDQVMALTVASTGQVVAGGRFDSMNGVKATGVAALDPVTGDTRPFAINQLLTNQGVNSAVYSLSTSGDLVVGTAYDFYGPGNLEGSFVVNADGGTIVEVNDCRGDSYSNHVSGGVVYVASHSHDCANIGGFPEQNPRVHKFGVAFTLAPTGTVGSATIKNANFRGKPAGSLLPWFPTMTPGTYTGQAQAGWSVTGNGRYVVYGGEFPRVNGVGQQGLVRYALADAAPNRIGPATDGFTATAASPGPGRVTVSWAATSDQDNAHLVYRVEREGQALPVAETVQSSTWWNRPAMSAPETGVSGTLRYRVTATDAFGNRATTPWATVEVAPVAPGETPPYPDVVRADGATSHWRLGDSSGNAADAVGTSPMTVGSGVTRGAEGAVAGDTAYSFNGSSTATLATQTARAVPDTFTQEAWFQTTSTTGGRIVGFANRASGNSTTFDRQVHLDVNGRVVFGVKVPGVNGSGANRTVTSTASYNDGRWHHVAATMSSAGMALYVDGALVGSRTDTTSGLSYTGFLRVGSDKAMAGANAFTGRVDEVALYPTALSAQQVAAHVASGTAGANAAPTARIAVTRADLAVALDASGSTDADGTVATYAWDLGDGRQASGATASHTYAAAGTYLVTLTVTDDDGATGTARTLVTVAAAPQNAAPGASFTVTGRDLGVAVDGSRSLDTDGTVTAHAWDFGDGRQATGVTATHTYAAAGTYTVTLTVTDDDGATGTATRQVTVTAPVDPTPLAKDSFQRTVTGGLGTADTGGAWTATVGAARQSVSAGVAEMALPTAGTNTGSHLGEVSTTTADVRTTVSLSSVPTGSGTFVYVTGRRVAAGAEYRVRVRVAPDGAVFLALLRLDGGVEAFPGGEVAVPGLTWTLGTALDVGVQVSGTGTTTVTGTVWPAGTAEPAPQLTRTDTTASLQAPGSVGLAAYRPTSATAATAVRFTALRVTRVGAGPSVNAAPTAAFTAAATDLAVAVDGSGSTDGDGRVVRWEWAFGDGGTATGTTASHTYAAAGTYTVTLTVTDDEGATTTTSREVTVAAPVPPATLAADAFERSVTGGLGTADVGGAWTATAGATRQAVSDGGALLTAAPAANTAASLGTVATTDVDVRTTVSLSAVPTAGTGVYAYVTGRRVEANLEYRAQLRVVPGGGTTVAVTRLSGTSTDTLIGTAVTLGGTYTADTPLQVRFRLTGTGTGTTTLAVTVWPAGTPEPATPTVLRTDTTAALQAAGGVGLATYLSGSATAPVVVRFDDLAVTAAR
jgi:PKD repeat protein